MQLPESLSASLKGTKGFDKEAFEQVHASGEQVTSVRLNPQKPVPSFPDFPAPLSAIPWCDTGYYLPRRPSFTFDPLFHAGCYYVQEASSMFLEQALRQTTDLSTPLKVLDLCAAPGGKSTHLQSLITPGSLLVSNEVIRPRAAVLKDNIIKWGTANVVVTANDPADFAVLEGYFDVIVVDAPCSGSGLFRREPEAIREWSESHVQLCSRRQQRILADVLPALKPGGVLIYSTCSYSEEEDEKIAGWLEQECAMTALACAVKEEWGIVPSGGGYRFWPDKIKGEGFFLACFRKQEGEGPSFKPRKKPALLTGAETALVKKWIDTEEVQFIRNQQTVYAWPVTHFASFSLLLERCRVLYSGILAGEIVRDKLVPDHALAMSGYVSGAVARTALSRQQAIVYLQKKEAAFHTAEKGWQLVTWLDYPLGWINAIQHRINNYYPKELRILKDN